MIIVVVPSVNPQIRSVARGIELTGEIPRFDIFEMLIPIVMTNSPTI
jgi:hypothetical protein